MFSTLTSTFKQRTLMLMTASLTVLISACSNTAIQPEADSAAVDPADINGKWRIEYIQERPVIDFSPAYIEFNQGKVSGNLSCNQFSGQYTQAKNNLSFGPLVNTAKMCGHALMDQEDRISRALSRITHLRYISEKSFLMLEDKNNHTLLRLVK